MGVRPQKRRLASLTQEESAKDDSPSRPRQQVPKAPVKEFLNQIVDVEGNGVNAVGQATPGCCRTCGQAIGQGRFCPCKGFGLVFCGVRCRAGQGTPF